MTTQVTDTRKLKRGDEVYIDFEIDKQVPAQVLRNGRGQVCVFTLEKYPRRCVFDVDGKPAFRRRVITLWQ